MKKFFRTLLLLGCFILASQPSFGQAEVTFSIDLESQMKDSVFIPTQHSVVVTGNQLPFTGTYDIKMEDKAPVDSIYVANVNFPASSMGKTLKYNFLIKRQSGNMTENQSRVLRLEKGMQQKLPIAHFNSFAW